MCLSVPINVLFRRWTPLCWVKNSCLCIFSDGLSLCHSMELQNLITNIHKSVKKGRTKPKIMYVNSSSSTNAGVLMNIHTTWNLSLQPFDFCKSQGYKVISLWLKIKPLRDWITGLFKKSTVRWKGPFQFSQGAVVVPGSGPVSSCPWIVIVLLWIDLNPDLLTLPMAEGHRTVIGICCCHHLALLILLRRCRTVP